MQRGSVYAKSTAHHSVCMSILADWFSLQIHFTVLSTLLSLSIELRMRLQLSSEIREVIGIVWGTMSLMYVIK